MIACAAAGALRAGAPAAPAAAGRRMLASTPAITIPAATTQTIDFCICILSFGFSLMNRSMLVKTHP
jgi:hypothetical protein